MAMRITAKGTISNGGFSYEFKDEALTFREAETGATVARMRYEHGGMNEELNLIPERFRKDVEAVCMQCALDLDEALTAFEWNLFMTLNRNRAALRRAGAKKAEIREKTINALIDAVTEGIKEAFNEDAGDIERFKKSGAVKAMTERILEREISRRLTK